MWGSDVMKLVWNWKIRWNLRDWNFELKILILSINLNFFWILEHDLSWWFFGLRSLSLHNDFFFQDFYLTIKLSLYFKLIKFVDKTLPSIWPLLFLAKSKRHLSRRCTSQKLLTISWEFLDTLNKILQ